MDEADHDVEILDPGKDFTSLRSPKALISKEETKRQKKKDKDLELKEKLQLQQQLLEQKIENLKLQAALQQQKNDLVRLSTKNRKTAKQEEAAVPKTPKKKQVPERGRESASKRQSKHPSDEEYYDEEADDANVSRTHGKEAAEKSREILAKQLGPYLSHVTSKKASLQASAKQSKKQTIRNTPENGRYIPTPAAGQEETEKVQLPTDLSETRMEEIDIDDAALVLAPKPKALGARDSI